ncbi:hypothetical protein [Bacillus cereus group sp. N24]|uniref:hypothetical protein n=1 Tax=Bacillus cereus group sp. N24 TaxID=2794592 RepID=UPI0018F427A1|nr:hypothetical protein [Bacillus cereus group sp. N24]MBJ7950017.1 hypothetical protein [Bacillus cereus group sp. N24]
MEIYDYLDQMQAELLKHSWLEIEEKYYELCSKLVGKEQAKRIQNINLDLFQSKLKDAFSTSLHIANQNSAEAIYFEYDMDNDWNSTFFICDEYTKLSEEDDDWASDWISEVEGPDLKEFAQIYNENRFDNNEKALGTTLYLIARTVVTFKKIIATIHIPICIGFHDQDPIMRIQE